MSFFAAPIHHLMSWIQYVLPVFFSMLSGWLTIWLTIKLLFRPIKPLSIAGLKIQGIIPANQQTIAKKIGELVSKEFLSFSGLQEKVADPENFNKLKPEIEKHIDTFLREKLKDTFPMLSMLVGDKTINQLKNAFLLELESMFPVLMKNYVTQLEKDLDLEKLIAGKIAGFSIENAEKMVYGAAKKQLICLQLFGAAIGLLLGLIHVFINMQLFT